MGDRPPTPAPGDSTASHPLGDELHAAKKAILVNWPAPAFNASLREAWKSQEPTMPCPGCNARGKFTFSSDKAGRTRLQCTAPSCRKSLSGLDLVCKWLPLKSIEKIDRDLAAASRPKDGPHPSLDNIVAL